MYRFADGKYGLNRLEYQGFDRKKTPPPGGVSYLLCSPIKNQEEEDPP